MEIPEFSMRDLLEAAVHYGHTPRRWNAKMQPYIFGVRQGMHIIDLRKTMPMLQEALQEIYHVAAGGGRILFVATKRQAQKEIANAANRCGQYYVNFRWLGGMMTNWKTITNSILQLKDLDVSLALEDSSLTKKERLKLERKRDKLERALGGIREMSSLPDIVVVIDSIKESIAIKEANKLNIPVVAVVDTNSDPDGINFPVPGNDDALRSISLYCDLMAGAVLAGMEQSMIQNGEDLGAAVEADEEQSLQVKEGVESVDSVSGDGVAVGDSDAVSVPAASESDSVSDESKI